MTDDEIINKFRKVLRDYIAGGLTPEEIEEIIDMAFSELDITNEHIVEQFRKGEANGISGTTQFDVLNIIAMKVKQEELMNN